MEETENICNMEEIATIEIRQSEQTGKKYFNFICWNDRGYNGLWQESKAISEDVINQIFKILEENTEIKNNSWDETDDE